MRKNSMSINKDYPFIFNANECNGCGGRCCTGQSGYVFVSVYEMQRIASALALSFESFCTQYVRKVGYRFSFLEKAHYNGLACIFLDGASGKCSICPYRPKQCRTFPFWESHKNLDRHSVMLLKSQCPGIYPKEKK